MVKHVETESRTLAARGCGEGRMGLCCSMDVKVQFAKGKGEAEGTAL